MKQGRMARAAAAGCAIVLVLFYVFLPLQETWKRENNSGRKKLDISAGAGYSWDWTPQEDGITSVAVSLSGMKKATDLILTFSLYDEKEGTTLSEQKKVTETEEGKTIRLQGKLRRGDSCRLSLQAEGEGSVKLRGIQAEDPEDFVPMMTVSGLKESRNPVLLYFAAGMLMVALTPVFQNRTGPAAGKKKEPSAARLLAWLTFVMIAGLGIYITVHRPMFDIEGDWLAWDEDTHWLLVQEMGLFHQDGLRKAASDLITWDPGYFPLLMGYNLGQIFTSEEEILYRTAIAFSSICYAAMCALAVRHAPRYKASFLVAGTMPTVIFLMTSMSYDTVVIGSMLLGTALLLETLDRGEPLTSVRAMAMILIMAFGTVAKPAYSIVLLTLLMIPAHQLGGKRNALIFRLFAVAMVGWCFAALAMPGAYEDVMEGDWRFEGASVSGQIAYILQHPVEGGLRPVLFCFYSWEPLTTWGISAWGSLGNNGRANDLFLWLMLAAAPLCTPGETWNRKSGLSPGRRIAFAAAAIGAEVIIAYGQFLASTPVGGYVQGMQPRYFIPVWMMMLLALMWPQRIRCRLGRVSEWAALAVWAASLAINVQNMMSYMEIYGG